MEMNNPLLIVVDPGHGGYDNGAQYQARPEKDDNLNLSLKVRDALLRQGVEVLMTRDTDVFIPLADRARMANEADADLFVSIHRNSYVEQTPTTNGVENYIYLTAPEATSGRAARLVLDNVVNVGVQSDRGVNRGNYYVLRKTRMPAMLLEMGFIINDEDNRLFDENLDAYGEAIARGIMEYFGLEYVPPYSQAVPAMATVSANPPVAAEPSIAVAPPRPVPVPPVGTVPPMPEVPVPPIGTMPPMPEIPVPPIGTMPPMPEIPVPPIGTVPPRPVTPAPPIGTRPPRPPQGANNRPNLVADAQQSLNSSFGAGLNVDGVYGPSTKRAVARALQREINQARNLTLAVDGIFGPKTRGALPTLRQGDQGNLVLLLQILLYLNGYDAGRLDGNYGPRTKTAVSMFQRDNFLVPDGVAGPTVFTYLLR